MGSRIPPADPMFPRGKAFRMRVLDRPPVRPLSRPADGPEFPPAPAPEDGAGPWEAAPQAPARKLREMAHFGPRHDAYDPPVVTDPGNPDCFWVAPEDDMPHLNAHQLASNYQAVALTVELEARGLDWWVREDLPCAWDRHDPRKVVCPDVMVGEPPAPDDLKIYQHGEQGQLHFVAEIGSRTSAGQDQGPKTARYAEALRPDEYLYFNPRNDELRLFRWNGLLAQYERAPAARPGWATEPEWAEVAHWAWSTVLEFWFAALGNGELRMFDRTGRQCETFRETFARAQREAERADRASARATRAEALVAENQARLAELERRLAALTTSVSPPRSDQ